MENLSFSVLSSQISQLCCFLILGSSVVAADFTVTNTSDRGAGSLHQAITDANALAGQDRVVFNIPGPGVHVIDVSETLLPQITDPVVIDGYTQPGAKANTLAAGFDGVILIQIDNVRHSLGRGLWVSGGNSLIRGLSITGFIGSAAIELGGTGNTIQGNFLGLRADGSTAGLNSWGVLVTDSSGTVIGGTTPAARNIISGNFSGIRIGQEGATILGNYIGTDKSGTISVGNVHGIYQELSERAGAQGTVIGGVTPGAGNLISGNGVGVQLGWIYSGPLFVPPVFFASSAHRVTVLGNVIGLKSDGTALSNGTGINISAGTENVIGGLEAAAGNIIAFNSVAVAMSDPIPPTVYTARNSVLSNSIYGNDSAISLQGRTTTGRTNDSMDSDEGANHVQNFPVVTSSQISGSSISVQGTLNSTPNQQFTIQLFADSNDFLHPMQTFLGTTSATTDNNGNANFSATVPFPDPNVTINATATDPAGNTSEFFLIPSKFRNLSTRARIQPGEEALIGGFITQGNPTFLEIIARAIGPSLSVGGIPVAGRMEDPVLEVYYSNGTLFKSNDNWRDNPNDAAEIQKYGLAPTSDLESAIVFYPGTGEAWTAVVRGKNGSSGIGLVEFYDVSGTNLRPANISTRGLVQPGDNVMIAGFILADGNGGTHVVVRALGPSLGNAGIANPLPDPTLELYNAQGATIAMNDNWDDPDLPAIGLAPPAAAEAALHLFLAPGPYTAVVRGKGGASGIGLVEVYQLQ